MMVARSRGTRTSAVGPGEADHQQRQHGQEEPGRHVPAPAGPLAARPGPAARRLVKRTAYAARRALQHQVRRRRAASTPSSSQSRSGRLPGHAAPPRGWPAGAAASRRCGVHVPDDVARPSPGRCAARRWAAPLRRRRLADLLALRGGGRGVPLAQPRGRRCDTSRRRPVSGSTSVTRPTSGSSSSRGSMTSTASTWWRAASRRSGRSQGGCRRVVGQAVEEVGDDHAQAAPALARGAARRAPSAEVGRARAAGAGAVAAARAARAAARSRWRPARCGPGSGARPSPCSTQRAEPVAEPAVRKPTAATRGHRQVALLQLGGAEVHAGAARRPAPRSPAPGRRSRSRTCGTVGAGGDRPVHPADVVLAGLVLAAAGRLAARAGQQAAGARRAAARPAAG